MCAFNPMDSLPNSEAWEGNQKSEQPQERNIGTRKTWRPCLTSKSWATGSNPEPFFLFFFLLENTHFRNIYTPEQKTRVSKVVGHILWASGYKMLVSIHQASFWKTCLVSCKDIHSLYFPHRGLVWILPATTALKLHFSYNLQENLNLMTLHQAVAWITLAVWYFLIEFTWGWRAWRVWWDEEKWVYMTR